MVTYERHDASAVVTIHGQLLLLAICCFVGGFAMIDCFIRYTCLLETNGLLVNLLNVFAYSINLRLGEEKLRVVENWIFAC